MKAVDQILNKIELNLEQYINKSQQAFDKQKNQSQLNAELQNENQRLHERQQKALLKVKHLITHIKSKEEA